MLTSLLDGTSDIIPSSLFPRRSMKSIGSVSLCHKAALWVVCPTSIRGTVLAPMGHGASHALYQTALQAASILIAETLKNGLYTSVPYQTIQDRNIPLKRTKTQIWVNNSTMNKKTWLVLFLSQRNYLT